MIRGKKGAGALILGVILILVIIFWAISYSGRECNRNEDCKDKFYCGSDFKCHEFPIIIKEVTKNNLFWPSIFLSIGIIAGAIILRYKKSKPVYTREAENQYYTGNAPQPYPEEQYYPQEQNTGQKPQ
jgi:hypothetical protein